MPLIDVGGFNLHYLLEGNPANPVVLLLNSLGADTSMWDAQVSTLLPYFRVLRYDTRGHGESEMPEGRCTLADLGKDALALLDNLGIDRVHVCGVSLGGLTAMWIGLNAAHRVRSLVLSNTAAKIGNVASWNDRIATVQAHGMGAVADAVVLRWFTPAFREDTEKFAAQKAMLLRCPVAGYVAASAAIRDSDLRDEIAALSVPTLVISGADDVVTPPSDGLASAAAIPGAIFREVPGAHLSNIEAPDAYNDVLISFLRQHRNRAGGDL